MAEKYNAEITFIPTNTSEIQLHVEQLLQNTYWMLAEDLRLPKRNRHPQPTYTERRVQIQSWTLGAVRTKKRKENLSQQPQEQQIKSPQSTWCTLHLWNTWIDNKSSQIEEVDFGSNDIYIYIYFHFYSFCDCICVCFCVCFVCLALLLPFVLGFCLSFFFLLPEKNLFLNNYFLF